MKPYRILFLILVFSLLLTSALTAQDTDNSDMEFGLGLLLGVDTFDSDTGEPETYQTLALKPDIALGDFGVGLDLVLHYSFVDPATNDGSSLKIRTEDWIPADGDFLKLYLPKITYIRYGYKGDSLYVKFGQIEDATLGTGFIVNNYSNTLFQPDEKIMGLNFDIDGNLFEFPYIGIETFAGNLASFDVFGGRLYGRPLLWLDIPVLNQLEWGITGAVDLDPDYRSEYFNPAVTGTSDGLPVVIYGTDLILPLLNEDIATLALFGDMTFQNTHSGSMVGFGGRLIGIIPYVFQLRFLGDDFIPSYFDSSYDIYRGVKYAVLNNSSSTPLIPSSVSWLATTGISLFDDMLAFTATLDGPFAPIPTDGKANNNFVEYPHLYALFTVSEGFIPDFSLTASYDKKYIASFADLVSAEDAMIDLAVNYNAGAAVITLAYQLIYVPDDATFDVNSTLSCSLNLF